MSLMAMAPTPSASLWEEATCRLTWPRYRGWVEALFPHTIRKIVSSSSLSWAGEGWTKAAK